MSPNISTDQWLAAAKYRRSIYPLKDTSAVSDERIEEIVKEVLRFAPSSYNSQPVVITLVQGEKHKQFWDVLISEIEPIIKGVSADIWAAASPAFQGFRNAHGSIVFWENPAAVKAAGEQHKSNAHMFPEWSDQANAMHQILIWSAIEIEGVGANLQHMNSFPAAEAAAKKFLGVPDEYRLRAHINYGDEAAPHPEVPSKLPFSETLKVIR